MTGAHEFQVHVETEFEGFAINDGKPDYLLRLARLIPTLNVIELKRKEIVIDGRRVIPLGSIANSINLYDFIDQMKILGLTIELMSVR